MTECGTLKLKFSAVYTDTDINPEDLKESIESNLAKIGDIETTYEEDDGEIEFNGILKMDATRTYSEDTCDTPGQEELSVSMDEYELRKLIQIQNYKPFVHISSEEWIAA